MLYKVLIWSILVMLKLTNCVEFSFYSTDARGNNTIHLRSGSTTGTVVRLGGGKTVSFHFCLRQKTTVFVKDIVFSNDGKADECFLYLDDFLISSFASRDLTSWGTRWNVFENATINKGLELLRGWHVLKLKLAAGDALEIDRVQADFSDQRLSKDLLDCSLMCQSTQPYIAHGNTYLPQHGVASQSSYPTKCAEEDNVKIPIVLQGILEYSVTATLPTYRSFENRRGKNTAGCSFLPHTYWTFKNVVLPSRVTSYEDDSAVMTIMNESTLPKWSKIATITFALRGQSEGHIDANIGSILTILIEPVNTIVAAEVTVNGRAGSKLNLPTFAFLPGERLKNVSIPDFTWSETLDNIVTLSFTTQDDASIITVAELRLERRPMKPERTQMVFFNEKIIVEVVYMDFWWRAPESMNITMAPNGLPEAKSYDGVAYFRISRPVPWSKKSFAQIFVMYQDGNVRLLQLPPPGLDWIPFGTSVIIGATDPYDHRPYAPISNVQIDPINSIMYVWYNDGNYAEIRLVSALEETQIVVSNLRFTQDMSSHPFATFRSMYVEDGFSDCDSIIIDGQDSYHIMDNWLPKSGKSFMCFRRCESKHLTLSPDILLKIIKTKYGHVHTWWKPFLNLQKLPGTPAYQFHRFS
ncbi:hypothetical protein LOTGIDRAFT_159264 [Lottia gigantea]|uniref:Uncharacterized protein n=1 Tax=Lottia gigantea TaxID=225164 RepID=V4AJF9_LOTGI|nr:hypothetical protein LOTGIDRAFT_159264 [Lottia gigantea]ESO97242.1 hypothetical protein LOTGIDRAFT_159264 [Lottia gigantea]